ncbi:MULTISPECIES: phage terminase small subunit P27 family [unclassified Rhizobium]|uniref:phage terminase small subunit P27 family n=1 Tax=unclassified Rhizobium TaxID=2613769 RepID=UPI001ADB281B|nr:MULTISPECIES: phage terminase small subunit P27 family [unclassified Rhizobium]MBO9097641.1 phage terminase small subunit P27 family [Rhizobium sp. L58/93]MBO9183836.1 phage terminase small subunit P27 family [Rhizobium sp. E27B/91]QXZ84087.1 phage terminase small subunit P27 family [Rhizobium sp. K1/93]QXZ88400.1 phage terminase small subunit P27 family [Rhizobium sp. K15/93]QYA00985.1 phage terminase small subunit P27 family [Rhizobium sp. B21/90]
MTHLRGVKPPVTRDSNALAKAPSAPKALSTFARAEWKRIMPGLIERGIVTPGDLGGVEDYCRARGLVREIEDALRASGEIDLKLCRLQDKAMQTARQLAAEYGLSPVSRARVGGVANDDDDSDNPLKVR